MGKFRIDRVVEDPAHGHRIDKVWDFTISMLDPVSQNVLEQRIIHVRRNGGFGNIPKEEDVKDVILQCDTWEEVDYVATYGVHITIDDARHWLAVKHIVERGEKATPAAIKKEMAVMSEARNPEEQTQEK